MKKVKKTKTKKINRWILLLSKLSIDLCKNRNKALLVIKKYLRKYKSLSFFKDALINISNAKFDISSYFTKLFKEEKILGELFKHVFACLSFFELISKEQIIDQRRRIIKREGR